MFTENGGSWESVKPVPKDPFGIKRELLNLMKPILSILSLGAFALITASTAHADWQTLPDTRIGANALGGAILLIQMKYSLVVSEADEGRLTAELGADKKRQFFRDMIMGKSIESLKETYLKADRTVTNATLSHYENLMAESKALTLN